MATLESSVSSRTDDAAANAATLRHERMMLVTIALATTLAPLNSTMIAVALPQIMQQFQIDLPAVGWLVTSYLIVMAAVQPVAGKLGDRWGRRALLLGGLIYFAVSSLGAALAPNFVLLLAFRVQQAIAGAIALPNASALVREVVPAARRAGSYGMVGGVVSLAAAVGPPLGGLLVGTVGWQAIFWINVPVVATAFFLGWTVVPRGRKTSPGQPFDLLGGVLLLAVFAGLSLLLHQFGARGATASWWLGLLGVVAAAVLCGWQELRHPDPVFRPRFFQRRSFAAATGAVALSNLAMYSTLLALPILLSRDHTWTSARIGLALTALSASTAVCGPIGGRLADRFGRRWPVVGGLTLFAVGLLPLLGTQGVIEVPRLLGSLLVAGIGLGLSSAGMQTAAVEAVGPREAGAASGMFSTSRYLGSITGTSVLPSLLGVAAGGAVSASANAVFLMIIPAAFLAAVVSLGLRTEAQS